MQVANFTAYTTSAPASAIIIAAGRWRVEGNTFRDNRICSFVQTASNVFFIKNTFTK
jgi:hypothetical protein